MTPAAVPAPGSEAARKAGCICEYVETYLPWRDEYIYEYQIDPDCELHGWRSLPDPLDNLTMRLRTDAETGGKG